MNDPPRVRIHDNAAAWGGPRRLPCLRVPRHERMAMKFATMRPTDVFLRVSPAPLGGGMSFSVEQNESGAVVIVDGPLSECYPEVENEIQSLLAREHESIELELRSDKFASIDIGALLRLYELTRTQGG